MSARILAALLLLPGVVAAAPWNMSALRTAPRMERVASEEPGVRALLYESVPFRGKATRVFAYYGAPARKGNERVPAMVLIHGGGGTAFAEWVRMWNARGYAAIAMDTGGNRPEKATPDKLWNPARKHSDDGGPEGWGGFAGIDEPESDQWTYHAVAAAVLAHSLLRTFPEVDAKRIGVTGISWGGYLTSIVAGLDNRFLFAAPVYGCGFLGEDSAWLKQFAQMGPDRAGKWLRLWDPSEYLAGARMPMLWVNGTNDFAYPMRQWQKSHRLVKGPRTLAVQVRMPHGHPQGAKPEEIFAFADAMTGHAPRPVQVVSKRSTDGTFTVAYRGPVVAKAELNFTREAGAPAQEWKWESVAASVDRKRRRASATIPAGARMWFVNLFDAKGLVVSTEFDSVPAAAAATH